MPKRILVVEDQEDNLRLVVQILELLLDQKYVVTARDGHEAIQMAYLHQPDIILMDLTMPKIGGWEAAQSLRADKLFKNTVILAITAHAMVGDRERALEAGCDDYIAKPIDVDDFIKFIGRYLPDAPNSCQDQERPGADDE